MLAYTLRRLLLMVPTILGIIIVTFVISSFVPGGPVDTMVAQIQAISGGRVSEGGGGGLGARGQGLRGFDPSVRETIAKQLGYDKPPLTRFFLLVWNYARFDFGKSAFSGIPVIELIRERLPVSISLGLWMTLLSYLISIPLGIRKAVRDGTRFDVATSFVVSLGFAVPSFIWGVLFITLLSGNIGVAPFKYLPTFPLRGLTSENFAHLSLIDQIKDYFWHIALPVASLTLGSFATVTALTKNSFLDEINKIYVLTARMKGATERRVLYGHLFRNSMMIVISHFPGAFVGAFFSGAILIETLFSLDGLGRLSYRALIDRDYPIVFADIYIFALVGLVVTLISDLTYTWVDPRIDFERREV